MDAAKKEQLQHDVLEHVAKNDKNYAAITIADLGDKVRTNLKANMSGQALLQAVVECAIKIVRDQPNIHGMFPESEGEIATDHQIFMAVTAELLARLDTKGGVIESNEVPEGK